MTRDEVREEQIKLTATFLNTIVARCVVAGIIAPKAALFLGLMAAQFTLRDGAVLVCASGAISAGLHRIAKWVLSEDQNVTDLEILAFVVSPLFALGIGAWAYWISGRET